MVFVQHGRSAMRIRDPGNVEIAELVGTAVPSRPQSYAPRPSSAFSLIELIVALGVTAVIAGIMITIVVNLLDAAQRATGTLMSSNQAKVALDFIAQDLQSAVMRPDGNVWLAATVQPDQNAENGDSGAGMARWTATAGGVTKPGIGTPGDADSSLELDPQAGGNSTRRLEDYRFGPAGVWLRFFAIEPDSNGSLADRSVVRGVGYQIIRYEVQDGGSLRYGLFRSFVRPFSAGANGQSTFEVGYDLFFDSDTDPSYNNPAVDGAQSGDPSSIRRPQRNHLLANNVIDFGVRFWARANDGELEIRFPVDNNNRGFAATSNLDDPVPPVPAAGAPTAAQMTYGFPEVAEIFMRVLSDDGAEVLEAHERNPFPGTTWWELALENSEVFTRRIEIKGGVP